MAEPGSRKGEGSAWAIGLLGLLGLAVPVGLFTDLNLMCALVATNPVTNSQEEGVRARPTIIGLELAGLHAGGELAASKVRDELARRGYLGCARKAVVADAIFLVLYASILSLSAFLVGRAWTRAGWSGGGRLARWLAGLAVVAAGLDFLENLGLLALLEDPPRLELAGRTAWCAVGKYGLVTGVLSAIGIAGLRVVPRWRRQFDSVGALAGLVGLLSLGTAASVGWMVARAWWTTVNG